MDFSTPGFPVHHQLPELAQAHVHWVSDVSQPSHPLSSLSLPACSIRVFSNESVLHISGRTIGVSAPASVFPMNIQYWFPLGLTGWCPCSQRDSQVSSPTPQFRSISSMTLSFVYGLTLTFIHDYWKNHSFDWMDLCQKSNVSDFKYAV